MAVLVLSDARARLEASAREVDDAKATLADAIARRDRLVVHYVDQGMSQRQVGKSAGIGVGRVCAILVASQPDDDQ